MGAGRHGLGRRRRLRVGCWERIILFGQMGPVDVLIDDIVRLRKPHPCGSYDWRVVRLGADIGLKCLKCGRRVLLPRSKFERRLKAILSQTENRQ